MEFFEKIGGVAKNLSDKAGSSLEINRLTGEISIAKGNIQCYQRDLGEHFWAKFVVGEKLDDEAMHICDKIVVSQDNIRRLELEIDRIKKERDMPVEEKVTENVEQSQQMEYQQQPSIVMGSQKQIGAEVETEDKTEVVGTVVEVSMFCSNCGGKIQEGQHFCIFCGAEAK